MSRRSPTARLSRSLLGAAVVLLAVASTACSTSSGDGAASTSIASTTTTTEGPHPLRLRVLGDGGGSEVATRLAAIANSTDLEDRSTADATLASLLDLEPETPAMDEGRLHETLVEAASDAPDVVVLSIGHEVLRAASPMAICGDPMWSTSDAGRLGTCIEGELDRLHFEQRVMAIMLDVLAHTRTTNVVVLRLPETAASTGLALGAREEVIRRVNQRIDRAAALTAEAGAVWADRSLVADPSNAVDAVVARGWLD